ncbi:hypothetical protein [Methylotenera sp. L2L1]|uniref:hypothetical protein n=1 Tax=Methylotenera sp. L2L1 TaxID=1502770 RepID=UPI000560DD35|nr:hypothetical protein [Methylotenera sp. L2L1]
MSPEYKLDLTAFWGMTGPELIAEVAPNALYEKFGYPLLNDGDSESMGTYIFVSRAGDVVTIYYRANDVWEILLRLVKRWFWRGKEPIRLTIGADKRFQAEEFSKWLSSEVPCKIGNWPW